MSSLDNIVFYHIRATNLYKGPPWTFPSYKGFLPSSFFIYTRSLQRSRSCKQILLFKGPSFSSFASHFLVASLQLKFAQPYPALHMHAGRWRNQKRPWYILKKQRTFDLGMPAMYIYSDLFRTYLYILFLSINVDGTLRIILKHRSRKASIFFSMASARCMGFKPVQQIWSNNSIKNKHLPFHVCICCLPIQQQFEPLPYFLHFAQDFASNVCFLVDFDS